MSPIDPIPPVQPIGFDARSTPRTMSPAEAREWLLTLPRMTPEHLEGALSHPNGFMGTDAGGNWFAAYLLPDGNYSIEQVEPPYEKQAKENTKMKQPLQPTMIIVPLIHDAKSPAPLGPKKALTLTQEILAKRGTIVMPTNKEPFHGTQAEIDEIVAETLAANPGARLASEPQPMRRYIGSQADEQIAKACSSDPEFRATAAAPSVIVKTGATAVEKPDRPTGTIDRSVIRADRAASESQAAEVMDRVRAKQASDPELKASAQRADGSFYREDGTPHENLSMTRRPADRDPRPGTAVTRYTPKQIASMDPYHQRILKSAKSYRCENCGAEGVSQNPRRFCDAHVGSGRGGEGLYDQEVK